MATPEDRARARAAKADARRAKALGLRKARKSRKSKGTKRDRGLGR